MAHSGGASRSMSEFIQAMGVIVILAFYTFAIMTLRKYPRIGLFSFFTRMAAITGCSCGALLLLKVFVNEN